MNFLNLKVYQDIDSSELSFPLIKEDMYNSLLDTDLEEYIEAINNIDLSKYGNAFKMYKQGNEYTFDVKLTTETIAYVYIDMIVSLFPENSKPSDLDIYGAKLDMIEEFNSSFDLKQCNFTISFTESRIEGIGLELSVQSPREIIDGYLDAVTGDILFEIDGYLDFLYGKDVKVKTLPSYDGFIKLENDDLDLDKLKRELK